MIAAIYLFWLLIFVFILAPIAWLIGTIIGKVYGHIMLAIRKARAAT